MLASEATFRIRFHQEVANYFYCGTGELGLQLANLYLDTLANDPTVDQRAIEHTPAFDLAVWDFTSDQLPDNDIELHSWVWLDETDGITGQWITHGGVMMDGIDGFNLLKPQIESLQGYADQHVRNIALGYAPIVTTWADWQTP
ncbi:MULTISPECIES: hypothetical protein [Mycolicibacterium]|uniref:Uncharacterized protein n=1 Tax=Mycobacterium phage Bipper TaxID=1805457 RepID=A0A142F2F8_9CAUD|nr:MULTISPECIES: hypothetical protein [Mycolicibacterium]YP_009303177.1 hypothetical protein KCH39_gp029 [Mycobacterium phage Bipper]AMQ66965.1 hypothetical protein SEA_BIPPER_29 [Mycobacterium phage Bipper]MCC9181067.1 hypothetical protein [Mycolicibacterium mageritense]UBV14787.1 hypothetical protein H8Z57_29500 [Mycolicibacterium fortuitum]